MLDSTAVKYTKKNDANIIIGQRIKMRRKSMHLTQKELADAIGVTFQQIQKYEAGINGVSLQLLIKICSVLRCNVEYFVDRIGLSDISTYSPVTNNLEDELLLAFRHIKKTRTKFIILELIKSIGD